MNVYYTNSNLPNLKALIVIVLILIFSIALKKCAAQVQVDSDVLKYLLTRSATAYYLEKDTVNLHNIIIEKDSVIILKDDMIANRNMKIETIESISEIQELQINSLEKQNKAVTKKAAIFKFTTYLVGILGTITTIIAFLH